MEGINIHRTLYGCYVDIRGNQNWVAAMRRDAPRFSPFDVARCVYSFTHGRYGEYQHTRLSMPCDDISHADLFRFPLILSRKVPAVL